MSQLVAEAESGHGLWSTSEWVQTVRLDKTETNQWLKRESYIQLGT